MKDTEKRNQGKPSRDRKQAREYAKARGFIGYTLGHRLGDYSGCSYADQMIKV